MVETANQSKDKAFPKRQSNMVLDTNNFAAAHSAASKLRMQARGRKQGGGFSMPHNKEFKVSLVRQ